MSDHQYITEMVNAENLAHRIISLYNTKVQSKEWKQETLIHFSRFVSIHGTYIINLKLKGGEKNNCLN